MSNAAKVITYTPKFTQFEIQRAVNAVALPASLQGVDAWSGSKEVGGNVASHLMSANGKGQTIGVCALFADWWFGAENLQNILKGLQKKELRQAFDQAAKDVIRPKTASVLPADTMTEFLREFVRSGMQQTLTKVISEKGATAIAAEPVSEPTAIAAEPVSEPTSETIIAMLRSELAAAQSKLAEISKATSVKAIKAILTA